MYHDNVCRCIQCAARPIITKARNDLTRTGNAALNRFDKQTDTLLGVEIRDAIADTIARKIEDFMPYESATVISADLAQTIQNDLSDLIAEIKSSATIIIGNFVKAAPIVVSNTILEYEKIDTAITTQVS